RKDLLHSTDEPGPFSSAEEAVAQQESAAQQVVPQLGRLRIGEVPHAGQAHEEGWRFVHVIAVVEGHRRLDGADGQTRQSAQDTREETVAARVVHRPGRAALCPVAKAEPAELRRRRIHQAGHDELARDAIIRGQGNVRLRLEAPIDPEGALRENDGLPAQPQSGKHGEENDPSPSATGVLCRGRPQRAPRGKSGQVEVFIELSPRNIASMWRISPSWILNASNTTEALLFGY